MTLSVEELTEIAKNFLWSTYRLPLEIPIKRNGRLRSTLGRYISTVGEGPECIEISAQMFMYAADSVMVDTLKHELVHYALDVKGEPNRDGNPHFESELKRLGVSSTKSCYIGKALECRCDKCGKKLYAKSLSSIERAGKTAFSKCCMASFSFLGERIYDGTEALEQ